MRQGKRFADYLSDKRVLRAAMIVGITAILLLFLSSFIDFNHDDGTALADAYAEKTEQRLLDIVSNIDGVGQVKIFLTMANSGENVYLKNSDTKTLSKEPEVRGVVVVCDGGDNPLTVSHVLEAVTKALDISSNKVCVTK